jgi:hypothetical protein
LWWPSTKPGWTINFEIIVSDSAPDFDDLVSSDCIGEVGRIPLPDGGGVWVLADEKEFTGWEASLDDLRREVRGRVESQLVQVEHPATLA